MPEKRLQRTREAYQQDPALLFHPDAFRLALRAIDETWQLPIGTGTMVNVEYGANGHLRMCHQSAKSCGCDPGVDYRCEQHGG